MACLQPRGNHLLPTYLPTWAIWSRLHNDRISRTLHTCQEKALFHLHLAPRNPFDAVTCWRLNLVPGKSSVQSYFTKAKEREKEKNSRLFRPYYRSSQEASHDKWIIKNCSSSKHSLNLGFFGIKKSFYVVKHNFFFRYAILRLWSHWDIYFIFLVFVKRIFLTEPRIMPSFQVTQFPHKSDNFRIRKCPVLFY